MDDQKIKLTRKGKPDRRVSESGPKNIKKALETRKKIFEDYNRSKKIETGEEIPVDTDTESESSYESDESTEEIVISSKKKSTKKDNSADYEAKINKLEGMIEVLSRRQPKKRHHQKKTVIQIAQPKKEVKPAESEVEKHLKRKILLF
jgi:hypothetical protein